MSAKLKRAWVVAHENSYLLEIDGYRGRCYREDRRLMDTFLSVFPDVVVTGATLYDLCFETEEGRETAITRLTADSLRATLDDLAKRGLDLNLVERKENNND